MERGVNSPLTSSLGRIFDAVAALVLGRRMVDYEAQAAIELEGLAGMSRTNLGESITRRNYGRESVGADAPMVLKTGKMWHALVDDLRRGVSKAQIAARFHCGIAEAFIAAAGNACRKTGIRQVVLSGGCMHNRRLARLLRGGSKRRVRGVSARAGKPWGWWVELWAGCGWGGLLAKRS